MTSAEQPPPRTRLVISGTCLLHGTPGFTNIVIRKLDGQIEIDPHVDGSCVIVLDEQSATALFDALGAWLG